MKNCRAIISLAGILFAVADALSVPRLIARHQLVSLRGSTDHEQEISRRSLFTGTLGAAFLTTVTPKVAFAQDEIPITPFNGLIFNYRGGDYGGLDASSLDEPSVPFKEFAQRLSKGEVKFVEFMAPHGDQAYVTFKEGDGKPIRIGEGYPIEKHDGWSSPAFVVRAVENNKVPYKFTVPGLEAYRQ